MRLAQIIEDQQVIPRNASEATDLQIAFFAACLNSNRLFIDRLSSLTTINKLTMTVPR